MGEPFGGHGFFTYLLHGHMTNLTADDVEEGFIIFGSIFPVRSWSSREVNNYYSIHGGYLNSVIIRKLIFHFTLSLTVWGNWANRNKVYQNSAEWHQCTTYRLPNWWFGTTWLFRWQNSSKNVGIYKLPYPPSKSHANTIHIFPRIGIGSRRSTQCDAMLGLSWESSNATLVWW